MNGKKWEGRLSSRLPPAWGSTLRTPATRFASASALLCPAEKHQRAAQKQSKQGYGYSTEKVIHKTSGCRQLDQVLARIHAVGYRPGRVATLGEFAKRWQDEYGSLRKPSTARAQASHLRVHIIRRSIRCGSMRLVYAAH